MSTFKPIATLVVACLVAACATRMDTASAPLRGPELGRAAGEDDIAAIDISIPPSGAGLPVGSGTVQEGGAIYAAKCQACHGAYGAGKPVDALVGGMGTLESDNPVRTVGSYWPYATTIFDYVRRAMPTTAPRSLTDDEVYALTAYILNLNGIVSADAVMNAKTLPQVRMPNRDGFVDASRR